MNFLWRHCKWGFPQNTKSCEVKFVVVFAAQRHCHGRQRHCREWSRSPDQQTWRKETVGREYQPMRQGQYPGVRWGGGGGGDSRWIFDVMLGSGTDLWPKGQTFLPEKCTHFTEMYRKFRSKMHPSLWNVQKIWPKIVPICIEYAWQILFKDIPLFLKSTEC